MAWVWAFGNYALLDKTGAHVDCLLASNDESHGATVDDGGLIPEGLIAEMDNEILDGIEFLDSVDSAKCFIHLGRVDLLARIIEHHTDNGSIGAVKLAGAICDPIGNLLHAAWIVIVLAESRHLTFAYRIATAL
jgi:hypothetical protein